ncbi:MAG: hypothetical protein R3E39_31725 [Anaerolineae bacterium]
MSEPTAAHVPVQRHAPHSRLPILSLQRLTRSFPPVSAAAIVPIPSFPP